MKNYSIETKCVHAGYAPKKGEPRMLPICQSTTFKYDKTEEMSDLFDLKATGYFYTRLQNPTNDSVAAKICELEGGFAAMLTSSGQAANFYAILNLCKAGDHILVSSNIYGGTYNLFNVTLPKIGIKCTIFDQNLDNNELQSLFKTNTKLVFAEVLSNPTLAVLDIERIAALAHENNCPLIVDNTFATPVNCNPISFGADIVTHSTTKYLDGHATSVGGCIVDSGEFDFSKYPDKFPDFVNPDESYHGIKYTESFGKAAYIVKATVQLMRDLGSCQAPMNAFLVNLGIETLALRMERHVENAMKVAEFLDSHDKIESVNYPGLKESKYHKLSEKYMPNGGCGVLSFTLKGGREAGKKFINKLELISIVTHVADTKSCILHPAEHTHRQLSDKELKEAGIAPGMLRLSVGIENADDIIADIKSALDSI